MAKYTGNSLAVKLGATTLTANLVRSVEISRSIDTYESSGATDTDKTYLTGKKGATVKLDAWDDSSAASLRTVLAVGTSDTLEVYPQGNTSGKPKISASVVVTDISLGVPHDGIAPVSVSMLVTGAVTETTVA